MLRDFLYVSKWSRAPCVHVQETLVSRKERYMGKLNAEQRRSMLASIAAKRKNASAMPKSARPTAKTSQEDYDETKEVTETETKDVTDDDKEAKRFARKLKRRAYKIAQDEHAEEIERIVDDEEEDVADDVADAVSDEAVQAIVDAIPEAAALPEEELAEIIEDAVEDAVEAAVKRSASKKKLARRARVASRGKKAETADGDISDDRGINIVLNRAYPINQGAFLSTGGRSDSAIFFSVILEYIAFGFALDEAVAQAVRQLRQAYPKSSYNCMIQSQDQLVALCAAGREKTSPRIVEIYDEYGKGEKAHDYRVMRYRDECRLRAERVRWLEGAGERSDDRGVQPYRRIPRALHLRGVYRAIDGTRHL